MEKLKTYKFYVISLVLHGLALGLLFVGPLMGLYKPAKKQVSEIQNIELMDIEFTPTAQKLPKKLQPVAQKKRGNPKSASQDLTPVPPESEDQGGIQKKALADSQEGQGSGGSDSIDQEGVHAAKVRMSYEQYLAAYINNYKRYPRIARRLHHQGIVVPKLVIKRSGELEQVVIVQSSGFATLDQGALELIRSLAPFKPLPDFMPDLYQVNIPIKYSLAQ